jgi:hypothetical protein
MRGKKVNLVGAATLGIGGWFMVGRKGMGVLAILIHGFGLLFALFGGFIINIVVWFVGMIVPGMLVRRDALDSALFDRATEQEALRQKLAPEENV